MSDKKRGFLKEISLAITTLLNTTAITSAALANNVLLPDFNKEKEVANEGNNSEPAPLVIELNTRSVNAQGQLVDDTSHDSHYSHCSHDSHASHSSHYSHYSGSD